MFLEPEMFKGALHRHNVGHFSAVHFVAWILLSTPHNDTVNNPLATLGAQIMGWNIPGPTSEKARILLVVSCICYVLQITSHFV